MNRFLLFSALFLLIVGASHAQVNEIPNPSFENWGPRAPVSYFTTNTPEGTIQNVFQSGDAQDGASAVQLIAQIIPPTNVTTAGAVSSCISNNCDSGEDIPARDQLFPISQRYEYICGYYKATFVGGDQLFIAADMLVESGGEAPDPVGGTNLATGDRLLPEPAADWTRFQKPITYIPGFNGTPDYTLLAFILVGPDLQANAIVNPNSTAFVDNIFFCDADGDLVGPGGGGDDDEGVLFIVDDASALNASDQAIQNLMESLDEEVTVVSDEAVLDEDANDREIIVISATAQAASMQANFSERGKPVLSMDAELFSSLGMTGNLEDADFGTTESLSSLSVVDGSHPIANGFTGNAEVYVSATPMVWGQPNASASDIVAEDESGRATIFAYEAGRPMVDGTAPARRLGFFMSDEGAAVATSDGMVLLENALLWVLGREGEISSTVDIEAVGGELPTAFALDQNYPNPFNPTTVIPFDLTEAGFVRLTVYNTLGQEVARLVDQVLPSGRFNASFEAADLPSGTYLYRLEANGHTQARTMLLLK